MNEPRASRTDPPKRPVGRPLSGRKRTTIMLSPEHAEKLRRYGDGDLSAGIARAAKRIRG